MDRGNTAPETRARYAFQDHLAAVIILDHLDADDLEGVLVERATDLALIPREGLPELISIKHREVSQRHSGSWPFGELSKRVLVDLYQAWLAAEQQCRVTFSTNAGFHDKAHTLEQACKRGRSRAQGAWPEAVRALRDGLGIKKSEATRFLKLLTLDGGRPGRDHIADIGEARMRRLLERHRPGPITAAGTCYEELRQLLEERATDRPADELSNDAPLASVADRLRWRELLRESRQYLDARELRDHLLRTYDRASVNLLVDHAPPAWQADPNFIGREAELAAIDLHLEPGSVRSVAPVIIYGIPGSGKTSLATQYAASRSDAFQSLLVNGENREAVASDLAAIRHHTQSSSRLEKNIAELRGPVTLSLPPTSAMLLIIDGVKDPEAIRGLIPSESLCRVIITATGRHVAAGCPAIELEGWCRAESRQYIHQAVPDLTEGQDDELARALHDHPLAIAQATSFCRASGRPITEFLRLLAQHPARMLERDAAPGHTDLITTTTRMLLETAAQQFPLSADLARAMAFLASEPIAEATLRGRSAYAWIADPPRLPERRRRLLAWAQRYRLYRYNVTDALNAAYPTEARPIAKAFDDEITLVEAIDTLVRLSLVRREPTGLRMHPLVAVIIRDQVKNPTAYLAVAFGWLTEGATELDNLRFEDFQEHLNHLHALTSEAITLGLRGPVVLMSCYLLALHLPRLPAGNATPEPSRYRSLTDIALTGHEIARDHLEWPYRELLSYVSMAIALAGVFIHRGMPDHAFARYEEILAIGLRYQLPQAVSTALVNMGSLAADFGRKDLRSKVATILSTSATSDHTMTRVALAHVQMRQLRSDGDVAAAAALCKETIALLPEGPDADDVLEELVFAEAARIAYDSGDYKAAYQNERRRFEALTRQRGIHPDRRIIEVLCSMSDAAMNIRNVDEAARYLTEAEALTQRGFEQDSSLRQRLLSAQGHLLVDQRKYHAARAALEETIALQSTDTVVRPEGSLAADHYNLALAQCMTGAFSEAVASAERAVQLDIEWFGPSHSQVARDYGQLAFLQTVEAGNNDPQQAAQVCEDRLTDEYQGLIFAPSQFDGSWWGGGVLAGTDELLEPEQARQWGRDILDNADRQIVDTDKVDENALFTVLNPLNQVQLRRQGPAWMLVEVWVQGPPTFFLSNGPGA